MKEEGACEPPQGEKGIKAVNERVKTTLGDCAVMLDLGEFLGLTPGKRAEMLGRMVGAAGKPVTIDTFLNAVAATAGDLPSSLVRDLRGGWDPSAPAAVNLDVALKLLAARLSELTGRDREATAALTRLTQSRSAVDTEPRTAADLSTERFSIRKQADALRAQLAADDERARSYVAARDEMEAASADVDTLTTGLERAEKAVRTCEAASAQADDAFVAAENETDPGDPPPPDGALNEECATLRRSVEEATRARAGAEAELTALQGRIRMVHSGNSGECPVARGVTCPIPHDVARRAAEVIGETLQRIGTLKAAEKEASELLSAALEKRNRADQSCRKLKEERAKQRDGRKAKLSDLRSRAAQVAGEKQRAEREAASLRAQLESAKARKTRAAAAIDQAPGTLDRADLERQLNTLDSVVADLDKRIASKEQGRALADEELKAREAQTQAADLVTVVRKAQAAAKTVAAGLLASMFAPVTQTVTDLLAAIRPGWSLEAVAEGGGIEFLAHTDNPRPVRWGALSGGEAVLFGAALSLALVRLQRPPSKFLLVEAAEVDFRNLCAFLSALASMGGEFDSIIVASCHAQAELLPAPWRAVCVEGAAPVTV
ncbi:MAG: hypothetical protein EPN91_05305 [Salinibacterium sp.]|nr:MAG: hypothetical protein EPN91_05305 [Salinibacterium sp.]